MTADRQPSSPPSSGTSPPAGLHDVIRIVLIYSIFAALLVLVSDRVFSSFLHVPETFTLASIIKGWAFVAVTAILLFFLLRRLVRRPVVEVASLQGNLNIADEESGRARTIKSLILPAALLSLLIIAATSRLPCQGREPPKEHRGGPAPTHCGSQEHANRGLVQGTPRRCGISPRQHVPLRPLLGMAQPGQTREPRSAATALARVPKGQDLSQRAAARRTGRAPVEFGGHGEPAGPGADRRCKASRRAG